MQRQKDVSNVFLVFKKKKKVFWFRFSGFIKSFAPEITYQV